MNTIISHALTYCCLTNIVISPGCTVCTGEQREHRAVQRSSLPHGEPSSSDQRPEEWHDFHFHVQWPGALHQPLLKWGRFTNSVEIHKMNPCLNHVYKRPHPLAWYKILSLWRSWPWTVPGSSMVIRWPQMVWCMSLIGSSQLWATPSRKSWMLKIISPPSPYVKCTLT